MEKWLGLGLGQEIYKMNLEHLEVLESREVLQRNHNDEVSQRDTGANLSFQRPKLEQFEKKASDYNPKNKILSPH